MTGLGGGEDWVIYGAFGVWAVALAAMGQASRRAFRSAKSTGRLPTRWDAQDRPAGLAPRLAVVAFVPAASLAILAGVLWIVERAGGRDVSVLAVGSAVAAVFLALIHVGWMRRASAGLDGGVASKGRRP